MKFPSEETLTSTVPCFRLPKVTFLAVQMQSGGAELLNGARSLGESTKGTHKALLPAFTQHLLLKILI